MLSMADQEILNKFVTEKRWPNEWLKLFDGEMELYARRGYHAWDGVMYDTFDIANVVIFDDDQRGQGWFTSVLDFVEPYFNIYVESIQQIRLPPYLKKRGYALSENKFNAFKIYSKEFKWKVDNWRE